MPNLSPALASPAADPDGDRQPNLLEFAFDANPLTPNSSPFSIMRATDGSISLTYPRRTGFSGLRYTLVMSNNLLSWSPVLEGYISETAQPVPGKAMEIVTDRIVNIADAAYFRLQVTSVQP